MNAEGNKLTNYTQISSEAVAFFQKLLGTVDPGVTGISQGLLEELLIAHLPSDAVHDLSKQITSEEIRSTMFSINGDKAPGPDGFSAQFFKAA